MTTSLQTKGGGITAWIPIETAYPSIAACSSQVYKALDGNIIAFDPFFPTGIGKSNVKCLPEGLTSSWVQQDSETTTVLDPTFVCPEAWRGLNTLVSWGGEPDIVLSRNWYCRSYELVTPITGKASGSASKCTSIFTTGQTVSYLGNSGSDWVPMTSVVDKEGSQFAWGFYINGINVRAKTTSMMNATTSATGVSATSKAVTTTSAVTSASNRPVVASSKHISGGAITEIVIGVLAFIALAALAGFLVLRRKKKVSGSSDTSAYGLPFVKPGKEKSAVVSESLVKDDGAKAMTPAHELPVKQPFMVYEMGGEPIKN